MSVEQFEPFVSAIGPIIPIIESELILTVKAIPNPDDLAGSCYALTPHTDLSYMHTQPVVQFLHCLENEATGGESILVDGFRVARDFQKNHPEYFGKNWERDIPDKHNGRATKCNESVCP